MRICSRCRKEEATVNNNRWCRPCKQQYDRDYYALHPKPGVKTAQVKQLRIRNRKFIIEYLSTHPCVDCGEKDHVVLQFDHQSDKKYNVSEMTSSYSIANIQSEINKCEIRCANCHIRRTAKQFNWYKSI